MQTRKRKGTVTNDACIYVLSFHLNSKANIHFVGRANKS